jgi:hypothetical protein
VDVGPRVMANAQAAKLVQPRERALHDANEQLLLKGPMMRSSIRTTSSHINRAGPVKSRPRDFGSLAREPGTAP